MIALTQDSTGKVHAIGWASVSDSGYYLRMTLSYTSGHISGFTLDTPNGIALPNHGRVGTELRADIKMVKDFNGNETLVYAINMATLKCTYDCDIKVYMSKATSLTPTSSSQWVGYPVGRRYKVFDSCKLSACSDYGFSSHVQPRYLRRTVPHATCICSRVQSMATTAWRIAPPVSIPCIPPVCSVLQWLDRRHHHYDLFHHAEQRNPGTDECSERQQLRLGDVCRSQEWRALRSL